MNDTIDKPGEETARQLAQSLRKRIADDHEQNPHPNMDAKELKAHLLIHELVEQQLLAEEPPEIVQALDRMLEGGLSRHEAVHALGTVVAREALSMLSQNRGMDKKGYLGALRTLTVDAYLRTLGKNAS